MAHIEFKEGQPIQALSGNLGSVAFRTRNGKTFMFTSPEPVLPKHPTRLQREQYRQRKIVNFCVKTIQSQIPDIQQALAMRNTIHERIKRLYKRLSPTIKSSPKLHRAILNEYAQKFSRSESGQCRENIGTSSRLKRDEILNS